MKNLRYFISAVANVLLHYERNLGRWMKNSMRSALWKRCSPLH